MKPIIVLSPAKINPYLRIVNRRKDGFHNLQTLFVTVDLCDEIIFEPGEKLELTCEGNKNLQNPSDNLIMKAAKILQEDAKIRAGAKIHLKKKIPLGAGLGGGSSNAATTLITLNKLWNLKFTLKKLLRLGSILGADVPFFVSGMQVAAGEGKGDQLEKLPGFPAKWMTLACPELSISTAWAYQAYAALLTPPKQKINLTDLYRQFLKGHIPLPGILHNDFEEVVFSQYPQIDKIKKAFLNSNAEGAIMTGSGSVVVGFFNTESMALRWKNEHAEIQSFVARPLCRKTAASA